MRKFPSLLAPVALGVFLSVCAISQAQVLTLGDVAPGSNAFSVTSTVANSTTVFTNANDELTFSFGSTTAGGGVAYNVIYFAPQTLALDEVITVSFSGTLNNYFSGDSSFRVGLFDSGDTKLTGNVSTDAGAAALASYTGYSAYYRAAGTPGTGVRGIYERTGANNNLWQTGTANVGFGDGTTNPQKTLGLSGSDAAIEGVFTITRTTTGALIQSDINGITYSFLDTASPFDTFDSLSFLFSRQSATNTTTLTLDSLSVAIIPEPSSVLLLAVGVFVLLAGSRCRAGRQKLCD